MNRRVKEVAVDCELLADIFRAGWNADYPYTGIVANRSEVVSDAKLERVSFDERSNCFRLLFSHPSWDEVPLNEYPPSISPYFYVEQRPKTSPDGLIGKEKG